MRSLCESHQTREHQCDPDSVREARQQGRDPVDREARQRAAETLHCPFWGKMRSKNLLVESWKPPFHR